MIIIAGLLCWERWRRDEECALDPEHWENIKDVSKWEAVPQQTVKGSGGGSKSVLSKVDGGQSESKPQRQTDLNSDPVSPLPTCVMTGRYGSFIPRWEEFLYLRHRAGAIC